MEQRFNPFGIKFSDDFYRTMGILIGGGYIDFDQQDDLNVCTKVLYSYGRTGRQVVGEYYYPFLDGSGKLNDLKKHHFKKKECNKAFFEKVAEVLNILDYELRDNPNSSYKSRDHIRYDMFDFTYGSRKILAEMNADKKKGHTKERFRVIDLGGFGDIFYFEIDLQQEKTSIFIRGDKNDEQKKRFAKLFDKEKTISFLAPFSRLPCLAFHDVSEAIFIDIRRDECIGTKIAHQSQEKITLPKNYFGM